MMRRQTPEDQQPRCRTARVVVVSSVMMNMQLQAQRANQVAISAKYSFEMTRCRVQGLYHTIFRNRFYFSLNKPKFPC